MRLRAAEPFADPIFVGNILRGMLGLSLRRVLCTTGLDSCDCCSVRTSCWFEYLFESKKCQVSQYSIAFETAPHPFVMEVPREPVRLEAGDPLAFTLILFGKAMDSVPHWVLAIKDLCQRGLGRKRARFYLEAVAGEDGRILYDPRNETTADPPKERWIYEPDNAKASKCEIEFITPCRIKHEGRLSDCLEFAVLITNILRRASAISQYHCGEMPNINFRSLIERGRDVQTERSDLLWTERPRYSSRQKAHMTLGGMTGRIVYRGDLSDLMSLLRFGEIAHIGKATAFGMGQYRCFVLP